MGNSARTSSAMLARDIKFAPDLTYFLQVSLEVENGRLFAYPIPGGGSGDFLNLRKVDGFLELPRNKNDFRQGEAYPFIPFRD
jgi:molybdopterin molybdotransferase